jgi:hypothetical protein
LLGGSRSTVATLATPQVIAAQEPADDATDIHIAMIATLRPEPETQHAL